jgi:hypothetical protein
MPADRPAASRPATSGGIVEVLGLLIGSGVVNVSRRPAAARSPRTCVAHEFPERVGVGGPAVQLFLGCPPAFGSGPEKRLRGWCQPRDQASMAPGNPLRQPPSPRSTQHPQPPAPVNVTVTSPAGAMGGQAAAVAKLKERAGHRNIRRAGDGPGRAARPLLRVLQFQDRPHLDASQPRRRDFRGDLDSVVEVPGLDEDETA